MVDYTHQAGYIPGVYNTSENQYAEKREAAKRNMKRYVDPNTGTISYSGADFTAVVFLPTSAHQYNLKLNQIENDIQYIREELTFSVINSPGYIQSLNDQLEALNYERERISGLRDSGEKHIRPVQLFDIQTLTISSHREKFPVRTLGRVHPKSHTRGPRTLAGTMIFTLFNKHALWDLVQATSNFYSSGVGINGTDSGFPELNTVLVDQLPPFDITLVASNELGDSSYMVLYGVEIVNDGRTISIQDIITENSMQFLCRDFEDLRPMTSRRSSLARGMEGNAKTASDVARERQTELERRKIRLNPFV
jgi:hypothetical protein